jgi:hypothetical protein
MDFLALKRQYMENKGVKRGGGWGGRGEGGGGMEQNGNVSLGPRIGQDEGAMVRGDKEAKHGEFLYHFTQHF